MFGAKSMLYLCVETPLHAGSGRGLGAVDLPIQRERVTGYPMVQASGIKGRLRADSKGQLSDPEWLAIFGPEKPEDASKYAGAFSAGDARILLFPVRSLAGVFAWTTSLDALARFQREAKIIGLSVDWALPDKEPGASHAWVNGEALVAGGKVVLEEFSFDPDQSRATLVKSMGGWLAENALPQSAEYQYWRTNLPAKLCILPENAFRDFVTYATEVQTHIRIDPDTKTVAGGALWTTENLPVDTVLYAPLMATPPRMPDAPVVTAQDILQKVVGLDLPRTHLGGDETTGQGMVALRFGGVFGGAQ